MNASLELQDAIIWLDATADGLSELARMMQEDGNNENGITQLVGIIADRLKAQTSAVRGIVSRQDAPARGV